MLMLMLNKNECNYICRSIFFKRKYWKLLSSIEQEEGQFCMEISEEQADEIRDLCGEQLQIVGFDEKYELTAEGEILESLVDKFFIG